MALGTQAERSALAGLGAKGWVSLGGIFGPRVFGILRPHILAHIPIASGPKARDIGGDLDRSMCRRQQGHF